EVRTQLESQSEQQVVPHLLDERHVRWLVGPGVVELLSSQTVWLLAGVAVGHSPGGPRQLPLGRLPLGQHPGWGGGEDARLSLDLCVTDVGAGRGDQSDTDGLPRQTVCPLRPTPRLARSSTGQHEPRQPVPGWGALVCTCVLEVPRHPVPAGSVGPAVADPARAVERLPGSLVLLPKPLQRLLLRGRRPLLPVLSEVHLRII